jgi:chitodextrinase
VSATVTTATIAWNASTDNVGVTGYDIYRAGTKIGSVSTTSYALNGLSCGTAYSVGVRAFDGAGNTSAQATMSITTSACADSKPPTMPGNVIASTRTTTSIALTWAAATDDVGVAGYGVYNGADLVNTTAGTTGIVSGLSCGANYTLAVDAFDASGNRSPKTTVMVSTLACADTTPPTQPTNLRLVSATTTSATLAWNAATDNVAVIGYDLYRGGSKIGSVAATSFLMNGLSCGTTYTIGVRAFDSAGNTSTQATTSIATSTCTTPSTGCPLPAYPDANCTGVPPATTLTPSGGLTISTAGTVIDGRDITGPVVVNAPNVTIRNSRIRSNAFRAIESNSTGLVVEDSEIINRPVSGQNNCHDAIGYGNYTVRRTEITGCENAADMGGGNITFEDNYVHDLDTTGPSWVFGNEPHTDGIQMGPGSNNIVVRHNTIDPTPGGSGVTSAIIMGVNGSQSNVRIEDNYLDGRGASYAIYANRQPSTSIFINRNLMQRGVYGYTACVRLGQTVTQFNDNRDFVTGALISPDNGAGGSCSN